MNGVPRHAPTLALPQRGREGMQASSLRTQAPSILWGEGWGGGHA